MVQFKTLLEINTITWLTALSEKRGEKTTLLNVPEDLLEEKMVGYDAIWLMGVWERSEQSIRLNKYWERKNNNYENVLPNFDPDSDIVGSAYSIHQYRGNPKVGGDDGIQRIHKYLNDNDQYLILDFVPNHVGLDHPWTVTHPEYFIRGVPEDHEFQGEKYYKVGNHVYTHGRDPYFPPWADTLQMDAFSKSYRKASVDIISDIARLCDGIRCDMAMLMVNEIFAKNWEEHIDKTPKEEYWDYVIGKMRDNDPEFYFLAEVYWEMERDLLNLGFDACYDKGFYDLLLSEKSQQIKESLKKPVKYQSHLLRFIENHDEPRAAAKFGVDKSLAAASVIASSPSILMIHEGQKYGHKIKTPVQLRRRPPEDEIPGLNNLYDSLVNEHISAVKNAENFRVIQPILQGEVKSDDFRQLKAMGYKFDASIPKSRINPIIIAVWSSKSDGSVICSIINYSSRKTQFMVNLEEVFDTTPLATNSDYDCDHILSHNHQEGKCDIRGDIFHLELDKWGVYVTKFSKK